MMEEKSSITARNPFKDPGAIPEGFVYRSQKGRYPWWVKSVDKITTPVDASRWERKTTDAIQAGFLAATLEDVKAEHARTRERMINKMRNHEPGSRLQDFALHYASETYFAAGVDAFTNSFKPEFLQIREILKTLIHPPEEIGIPRWEGSEEEASAILEAAGIHLGAQQVGFTALNPDWLEANVFVDAAINKIKTTPDGRILIPEHLKYVVVLAGQLPLAAMKRSPSQIGDAADRSGYENRQMAQERMINFIRGLGYKAVMVPGFIPPAIPFALLAGLGEMGRMNRLISPLYGGGLRIETILTDLPLALDKPINFGLQTFCKGCKKCARACPGNAISMDDEPSWTPQGPYSKRGKKVWFENYDRCSAYTDSTHLYCGACMAACTWNKGNETTLHSVARVLGATLPSFSPLMAFIDDLFGYGLVPKKRWNDWWKLKLPVKGFDSRRNRS
jgi:reductive dehalogenase